MYLLRADWVDEEPLWSCSLVNIARRSRARTTRALVRRPRGRRAILCKHHITECPFRQPGCQCILAWTSRRANRYRPMPSPCRHGALVFNDAVCPDGSPSHPMQSVQNESLITLGCGLAHWRDRAWTRPAGVADMMKERCRLGLEFGYSDQCFVNDQSPIKSCWSSMKGIYSFSTWCYY